MDFPNYFADAESNFEDSEYVIFGVPYDFTSSFRIGAKEAPDKIRFSSWNFESFDISTGVDLKDIKIHDYGDLPLKNSDPLEMVKSIREFVSLLLRKNKFPIAIGGEHSITPGIIQAYPKDIAVLFLDAHIDFRQKYKEDLYNHACVLRRIIDHVNIENVVVIGVRSAEKEEFEQVKEKNLFFIDSFNIRKNGIEYSLKKVKDNLINKQIYLTLDIDVLDPSYAPGTSTPEPFGLTPFDIIECINCFSDQLVGFDIVEVCPPYDKGETAILAAKLIRYLIERSWINKKT